MVEGPYAAFVLTAIVGVVLAGLSWFVARRSGMLPLQAELVDTLQETVQALEKQKSLVQEERDKAVALAETHGAHVIRLNEAILDLVVENTELRRKAGLPPRHHTDVEKEAMS